MGLLAIFLMLVIVPCLISVHGGRDHIAVVQKITGIEQFVPPPEGCRAWVTLDASKGCTWCQQMFRSLLGALIRTYHPIEHFYSPAALVASHKTKHRDMKGTCFVNYLVTDNYKGLGRIFNPEALSKIRTKDWIIFVEGEKTSHFLKCWADTIDTNFGLVFPKVVLIMMHEMKIENDGYATDLPGTALETVNYKNAPVSFGAAVACYMCPEGKSYFVGIQQGDKNPYNLLKKAGDRKGNYGPPGISAEAKYFTSWRPTPHEDMDDNFLKNTMLSAVQQHLEFTYVEGDPKSGLILETVYTEGENEDAADLPKFRSAPVKRMFLTKYAYSLVYCRTQHTNKHVTALISPFETALWIFFWITFTSICLVAGVRFWGGLDLFWLMQGQPPQAKKIGVLFILASIVCFPLQVLYKEYFASNAMTPYKMDYLDTNQKIFNSKFRYICYDDIKWCVKHVDSYLSGHNIRLDVNAAGEYFIGPEEFGTTSHDAKALAKGRDVATYPLERNLKKMILLELESYVRDTECFMAEELWWVGSVILQFSGPLSKEMHKTIQTLREAGIINFWYKVPIAIERRRRRQAMVESSYLDDDEDDDYDFGIEHMNRTLMSLVVLYLGLCALAIFCLLGEIMFGRIVARWKRWRERRRYLRAIWPLGKI